MTLPDLVVAYQQRQKNWGTWQTHPSQDSSRHSRESGNPELENWTEKWWFASIDEIKANDCNLSAGRYRPLSQSQVEHRDPKKLLDELAAIEMEIMEEINALKALYRKNLFSHGSSSITQPGI